jgi:hypothetical protein
VDDIKKRERLKRNRARMIDERQKKIDTMLEEEEEEEKKKEEGGLTFHLPV